MAKKKQTAKLNWMNVLKGVAIVLALPVLIASVYLVRYYFESFENDSLPKIESNNITMEKVHDNTVKNEIEESKSCSEIELNVILPLLKKEYGDSFPVQEEYVSCKKFVIPKGNFYDIYPSLSCRGTLLLEKTPGNFEFVIKSGSNEPKGGYPCNGFAVRRLTEDGIVISFEGYHNPSKLLRLTIN